MTRLERWQVKLVWAFVNGPLLTINHIECCMLALSKSDLGRCCSAITQ